MTQNWSCPLCKSPISESKFFEISRLQEAKIKFDEEQKKKLATLETQKKAIDKRVRDLEKKAEKERKVAFDRGRLQAKKENKAELSKAKSEGIVLGIEKQTKRYEVTNKRLNKALEDLSLKDKEIKMLKEQATKGTTSQIEGLELENELVRELKQKFPNDEIIHYGKGGDILHKIKYAGKEIGSILYECKKTKRFDKKFINQIKTDMHFRNATFGVLLTYAFDKKRAGFWIEKDILIVHPYGTVYIAEIIRRWLVSVQAVKLSKDELTAQAKKLWDYIKGDSFKNGIRDTIWRTKELDQLLEKEKIAHEKIWELRDGHYKKINENTSSIDKESKIILKEEEALESQPEPNFQIIPLRKKKKFPMDNYS